MIPSSLKNIHELPASLQPIISEFIHKLLTNLDDNIISVIVYGSAAGVNYNPGVSDINLAVIVKNLDLNVLRENLELVKWGHKKGFAIPLFLTKEYILNSLDVFPIEFSEIKARHQLIAGEDVFKDLDIPLKDVRIFCEQQIKGKLLHLRQAYLQMAPNQESLKKLLLSAFKDLVPVFRHLIILKGQAPRTQNEAMLEQLAEIYSLDKTPLLAFHHDKNKKNLISSHQVEAHLDNFLNQLISLSRHLDFL